MADAPEIVIVGGGIGGGALATVLARQGLSVVVIERDLRAFLAGEGLLELLLDRAANQVERAEPDAFRVLGRRMQRDLLERDRRTRIALVKALRARQLEGGCRRARTSDRLDCLQ